MKRQAARYAIIRFQPHVETGEFANVGVVVTAPQQGYFDFRLETKRTGRLTAFFGSLDVRLVRRILQDCHAELTRIRSLAGYDHQGQTRFDLKIEERAEHLFAALTKDREGIINFSEVRYVLDENPGALVDRLFETYIARSFVDVEYKEKFLERHVRNILRDQQAGPLFHSKEYSDGLYSARFPFVGEKDGQERIVLKPIYLGQEDPTTVIDHANKWLFRVSRLRRQLPKNVTFAVEGPVGAGPSSDAFHEASRMLERSNIVVIRPDASELRAVVAQVQ